MVFASPGHDGVVVVFASPGHDGVVVVFASPGHDGLSGPYHANVASNPANSRPRTARLSITMCSSSVCALAP